jgi:hypothetical protein
MKGAIAVSMGVVLVAAVVCSVSAQDAEYSLKDYMPQGVGSTWTMKSSGGDGDGTVICEVLKKRELGGNQVTPIVTKGSDGNAVYGSIETLTAEKLTIFGAMFGRGGDQGGGAPTVITYEPAASFPGKLRSGQSETAKFKINRGERQMDITLKLELAAVETVTVPKGTFEGCLKLVYTTSFGQGQMTRTVWYAKGVGMVKSQRTAPRGGAVTTDELTDYKLAG